jgi:hypothetical protein
MPVGDTFRVRRVVREQDQTAFNIGYWQIAAISAATPSDAAIAAGFDALFSPLYQALLPAVATYRGTGVQYIGPGAERVEAVSTSGLTVGSNESEPLPTQVAGLISLRTNLAGRANRGRVYIPFPYEDASDGPSQPNATYLLALDSMATAIVTPLVVGTGATACTLKPVIYHRASETLTDIVGYLVRSFWATIRKRSEAGKGDAVPF